MYRILLFFAAIMVPYMAQCCTSMIVSARASATGRPLIWKHRDTGADNNFLARVAPTDSTFGYVGLYNAGDSLLAEAWQGMNDRGLAIMNTASYNLAPDTAQLKDCEALVMTAALRKCVTVDDFEDLLASLPKPLGVQANFGVIDAFGGAAYFETSDHAWTRFDVADAPGGVLIRTNYSVSGERGEGYGYIRYNTADSLTRGAVESGQVSPELLTDTLSRSFFHSLTGHDYLAENERYVCNRDFIPRDISTSSIVIEGVAGPGQQPIMWAALGYPPVAEVHKVTLDFIPDGLTGENHGWRSPECDANMELRRASIPENAGANGADYLDLDILRPLIETARAKSLENYRNTK